MTDLVVYEMNNDVLTQVFNANSELQHEVLNDMIETEMNYVGDQLDYFRESLKDYSVGTSSHIYLDVKEEKERNFIHGVMNLQNDYCFLPDDDEFIAQVAEKIEQYENVESYSDEYYSLQNEVEQLTKQLTEKIAQQFKENLHGCYDRDAQLSYFLDFYRHERLNQDAYIIVENDDFILHEDISYTKKYG